MQSYQHLHNAKAYTAPSAALEIRDLRLIAAVAEEGSLTRARGRLHVTQPALSRHLGDLEARLRVPLFTRTGRRMVPTAAGERLWRHAREVLHALGRAEADMQAMAGGRGGSLRIGTECYTCYHWLPRVLARFGAEHPDVEVRVEAGFTRRPVRALLEGRLDVALVSTPPAGKRVQATPVVDDELVAVVSPSHPWAARPFVTARDFADQHLVVIAPPEDSTIISEVLGPAGVTPARVTQMPLTEAIVAMVEANLGMSVLARWAVAPSLRAGRLRAVRITRGGLRRRWYVVTRAADAGVPHLGRFAALVADAGPSVEPVA